MESSVGGRQLPDWDVVATATETVVGHPKDIIFNTHTPVPHCYYLRSGFVRLNSLTADGAEWVMCVFEPGEVMAPPVVFSMTRESPALSSRLIQARMSEFEQAARSYTAVAMTEVVAERVPYQLLQSMSMVHLEWAHLSLMQIIDTCALMELANRELLTMTPLQRYERLLETEPHLLDLMPKKDVASMLGITPESFSRMLARRDRPTQLSVVARS